ncbi:hypothetical protein [Leifsonia xyli]|uniref:hypothetical protein n=1 Tax=Leifsonia xyli TaxID=1575 RepID=UPI003D66811B
MTMRTRFGVIATAVAFAFLLAACTPSRPSVPVASQPAQAVLTCPQRHAVTPTPSRLPGAGSQLVPLKPRNVLVCRYGALPGSLRSTAVVSNARDAAKLASFFNRAGDVGAGRVNCPMDDGESADFTFSSGTTRSELTVGLTGCRTASNGTATRLWVVLPPALLRLAGLPADG